MADPDGRRDPRAVAAQRLAEERGSLLVLQVPPLADEALLDPPAGLPRWHGGGGLDNTLHFAEWACGAVESVLPPSVVQQLRDFSEGDGAPALLLRGLGVDGDLEGTLVPAATRGYIKRGQRSETWILGLAMLFGDLLRADWETARPAARVDAAHQRKLEIIQAANRKLQRDDTDDDDDDDDA